MSSWRDDASPLAQQDLDRLLNDATVFAQLKVGEDGTFFPFAVVVHGDGVPRPLMIDPGDDEPDATEVVGLLWCALSEMRGELRATAVCVDVRMPTRKCDGIQVYLEHREGLSITTMPAGG